MTLTIDDVKGRIYSMGACADATEWLADVTTSPYQAWRACERGDWLLWLCGRLDIERKLLVRAAVSCAWPALKHVLPGEDRPRIALETALSWCDGGASLDEVRATATATAAAVYAAAIAAIAATAATAAAAAAYADAYADADAARSASYAESARRVREVIPWRVVRDALMEVRP